MLVFGPNLWDMSNVAKRYTVGERIRGWRTVRRWTIRDLASETGMHRSSIHRMETGQQEPREPELQALAKGLRLTMPEFYDDAALTSALASNRKAA